MVYYFTSRNVKLLRNIIEDYQASQELSPYEYIKLYMEKCPEEVEESKLLWIKDSFLGIQKHKPLLQDIAAHMFEEITEEDQQNFMIIFHALIFEIQPKDMQNLYKCMFNLSKNLLGTLTNLLSNNEILTYISHVAQKYYDAGYITEQIINPLFTWQPYISEIAHDYAEYLHKIELRKTKPPTVPTQPNVLSHMAQPKKTVNTQSNSSPTLLPSTPPNSENLMKPRRMLSKTTIDKNLNKLHERNKEKATRLLNSVKNKDFHFAKPINQKNSSSVQSEVDYSVPKYKATKIMKGRPMPIKENAATLKRINNRIQQTEQQEIMWLQNLLTNCSNSIKIEEMQQNERQEKEKERMMDIERKHIMGQISHEEALISKKKLYETNKKKYEEFLKEKALWIEQIENWKKTQEENNHKQVERLSLDELSLQESKNEFASKKKEQVERIRKEHEALLERAMRAQQEELDRKINMIKEMKVLAMIAKKAKVPRVIDLTETAGFGFLCEMSVAELQERLYKMKMEVTDELENKRKHIRDAAEAEKRGLQIVKNNIQEFMNERAAMRKNNKRNNSLTETAPSKEISDLKRILEEKRNMRLKLNASQLV